MLLDAVGWPSVMVALISGLPAIIGALTAWRVHSLVKTPSGTPIGKQVEDTQHVALANHYALRASGMVAAPAEPGGPPETLPPDTPEDLMPEAI